MTTRAPRDAPGDVVGGADAEGEEHLLHRVLHALAEEGVGHVEQAEAERAHEPHPALVEGAAGADDQQAPGDHLLVEADADAADDEPHDVGAELVDLAPLGGGQVAHDAEGEQRSG